MDANRPAAPDPDVIGPSAHGVAAERDVVPTPVVVWLFGFLAGLSILAAIVTGVLFFAFEKRAARRDRAAVEEAGLERPAPNRIPPPPRLEIQTQGHFRYFRDAEQSRLSSYGWMDKSTGAVHIPIDRAMDLIAERGVGALPPAPLVVPAPAAQTAPGSSMSTTRGEKQ
jgi:hypothetical protein